MERTLKNVILDLDSTVISSLQPGDRQPTGMAKHYMKDEYGNTEYIVYERPYLQEFLDFLFANYKVAVWTAASKDYAIFIIEEILLQNRPERKLEFLMFNYHGEISSEVSECPKDLSLVYKTFPSFTKHNTIIVDDYDAVYSPQMKNSYPIYPFEADRKGAIKDVELLRLQEKMSSALGEFLHDPNEHLMSEGTVQMALRNSR